MCNFDLIPEIFSIIKNLYLERLCLIGSSWDTNRQIKLSFSGMHNELAYIRMANVELPMLNKGSSIGIGLYAKPCVLTGSDGTVRWRILWCLGPTESGLTEGAQLVISEDGPTTAMKVLVGGRSSRVV